MDLGKLIDRRNRAHFEFTVLRGKECPRVRGAKAGIVVFTPAVQELWLKYVALAKECWLESRRQDNGSGI